jgi:hypothetical protein
LGSDSNNSVCAFDSDGNVFELNNEHKLIKLIPVGYENGLIYFVTISEERKFYLRYLNEEILFGEGYPLGISSNEYTMLALGNEFR